MDEQIQEITKRFNCPFANNAFITTPREDVWGDTVEGGVRRVLIQDNKDGTALVDFSCTPEAMEIILSNPRYVEVI